MIKVKNVLYCALLFPIMICLPVIFAEAAGKQTIYNSPYVTFSPDGKAWTTNAGDANYVWYDKGTTVTTGIPSSLRGLETGEHYYKEERQGEVPIGYWRVEYRTGTCIHSSYPNNSNYHGIVYGTDKCLGHYYSAWEAYCADCKECITDMYMYMSKEAAESIDYMDLGNGQNFEYYYLCPLCNNLEQGKSLKAHMCKSISWNQYKVHYDANISPAERYGGYMADSIHMYNNAVEYNGEQVTPATHLTRNTYTRIGYEFIGWNTTPDGTGAFYEDEAEVYNLCAEDWKNVDTWTETSEGIVTLYAQWRPSASILKINPNGGSYQGSTSVVSVTDSYGANYTLNNNTIIAPKGYTVSFRTNGGKEIAPITGTRHFAEWSMQQPFIGRMKEDIYYFTAPDGNVDMVIANYEPDPITLPGTVKPGSSFGGWYYDPEFTNPAGGAGDTIIPPKDLTLYANWVDLKLYSKDNYTANGGKGAVDLSWTQSDGNNKNYKLYQSRDNVDWRLVTAASDIGDLTSIFKDFTYTGKSQTYVVPYSGIYILTAYGAQGGNYDCYKGGYGGSVTVKVWLKEGEKLTYTIGGQNGYNGGGSGSIYASGGGATTIVSDRQGTLLVAGGGGSASPSGNGGAGGSGVSLRKDGNKSGADGQAGGGGGFVGGNAGELITHVHEDTCYYTEDLSYTLIDKSAGYTNDWMNRYWMDAPYIQGSNIYSKSTSIYGIRGHILNQGEPAHLFYLLGANLMSSGAFMAPSWSSDYIPTNGNTTLNYSIHVDYWGSSGDFYEDDSYISIYNQDGKLLFSQTIAQNREGVASTNGTSWQEADGSWHGTPDVGNVYFDGKVILPEETKGIYFQIDMSFHGNTWVKLEVEKVSFSGGENQYPICGYTEGQVISSKPAYGGSNYVNTSAAYDYSQKSGIRAGNGAIGIRSEAIGYIDTLSLNDVVATDFAPPDMIAVQTVIKEALDSGLAKIVWQEPKDNGTEYYHVAESYMTGSLSPLCRSNVTKNILISGIKGYYYLIDNKPVTNVTRNTGSFTGERSLAVAVGTQVRYLHVAAVDRAGNIGTTAHIRVDDGNMLWKLYTRQLSIEEADNVYPAERDKTWYVRADGISPFLLQSEIYMDGKATIGYQPNYIIYESLLEGTTARNIIYTPSDSVQNGTLRTDAEGLFYSTEGVSPLGQYPYSYTVRADQNRTLSGVQKFTLNAAASGKQIEIIPIAGADKDGETIYSDYASDRNNSITIIGDGEAPVINGLELLENAEVINRNDGTIFLNVTATDTLSGVRDFHLEITNTDNAIRQRYDPDENGNIKIEITKDEPIFSGDFQVTAYAADHVGNERKVTYGTTEFALSAKIERILEPHDPVFACGESGILTIITYGYADRVEVEFPAEMIARNPELNRVFDYTEGAEYVREEKVQFMIPLETCANTNYTVTVRAYKDNKRLEDHPSLSTVAVEGSILEQLRTRLR